MSAVETSPRVLRVALAQIDATVGDLDGNSRKLIDWTDRAREAGADLVIFPELALPGYPPEDLLLKPSFIRDNLRYRDRVVAATKGIAAIFGFVDMEVDIYNAAAIAADGELKGVYHKFYLPNYGVFDEERYFRRGSRCPIFEFGGVRVGVSICEDAWYPTGPISLQALHGAELRVNINGSPYHHGKRSARETMIATRAMDSRAFVAWVNLVGGLDVGSVFGERLHDTRLRREATSPLQHVDMKVEQVVVSRDPSGHGEWLRSPIHEPLDGAEEIYAAVVSGTRDYVLKNGFTKVLLGLAGRIDSALTAAVAADALGPENVVGVLMASRYTSKANIEDAEQLAENPGI